MRILTAALVGLLLVGCAATRPPTELTAFRAADPKSILIVPVVNQSLDVDAPSYMAYGPNQLEYYQRLPVYIDKILKGATPADLPIEQATKFDLIINLKTAKALGLPIPQSLLLQAELIE